MRQTFKLEVKEEMYHGAPEYYFTIPNEIAYNLQWYPGDMITWEVNGDSIIVYHDKKQGGRLR